MAGSRKKQKQKKTRGFTLIELMIVISVILILVSVALPAYNQSIWRARESVLKQNLFALRSVISQYTLDKKKAPQSLEDLVTAGYFKQIPTDPMTRQKDWNTESAELLLSPEQASSGISDVHSSSDSVSPFETTPYSSW